ncbi:MAG: Rne/Rng family ribonuclease [Bacteroidota bacterium]|nr:Rne/Rng family ribonuclease [Bacteroidota bacterium]
MNELVIDKNSNGIDVALIFNKQLTELHKEDTVSSFQVGDVYLAKIKKIMPNLNAAFLDVGHERDAFLHYTDLGPNFKSVQKLTKIVTQGGLKDASLAEFAAEEEIVKTGKVSDVLKKGDEILVQIFKEPIGTKGPRITCDISFAGRFSVLVPFGKKTSISKKISDVNHKKRLKQMLDKLKPQNFGVIIRTVAEEAGIEEIEADLNGLIKQWEILIDNARNAQPIKKVLGEISRTEALLRDLLNDDFSNIHVNDEDYANKLRSYITNIAPGRESLVRYYNNKVPIFQHFGIDKQIKSAFGKNVMFSNGAYLIIEHTEAMHVIDVNSGRKTTDATSQQDNALKINLEATKEIARQLRLRDLGGIIVIDFIDLKSANDKKELHESLFQAMKSDRSKHNILPMSKFGLVQITRERVRPEMNINTSELCPSCNGTGAVVSSMLLSDSIEEKLNYIWETQNIKNLRLKVNPIIKAYLTKGGMKSVRWNWYWKYKKWVKVVADNNFHLTDFSIFNDFGDELS